jgi:hypothetical protein
LQGQPLHKIEEDTDRDRYMSPLEARDYGIIDHIIGGDDAVFKVKGSTRRFPKVVGTRRDGEQSLFFVGRGQVLSSSLQVVLRRWLVFLLTSSSTVNQEGQ